MNAKEYIREWISLIGLIVVLAVFGIWSQGQIFVGDNLLTVVNQSFTTVMLCVGLSAIYAQGGMDFSAGGVIALSTLVAVAVANATGVVWLALPASIITAMACYAVTGFITISLNMNAYIGTVAMMSLTRGIVNSVMQGKAYSSVDLGIANEMWFRFICLAVVIAICWLIFSRTKIGRASQAYGENRVAASQTGLALMKYRFMAYLFGGLIVGIATFFLLARTGNVSTSTGLNEEFNVITALALGGMAMSGGVKTAIRCGVIGGIIISVLTNGMVVVGIPVSWTYGVRGLVFLIVVAIGYTREAGSKVLPR